MALPDPAAIKVNDGDLCINPTDLSAEFPCGGTALGLVMDSEWKPSIQTRMIHGEEYATPVEAVYVGESAVFAAALRDYDADALATVFPNVDSEGTISYSPGDDNAIRAGHLNTDRAVTLLFVPKDTENPALILYNAVPLVDETAALSFTLKDELVVPVVFHGLPDDAGRVYASNQLSKLSL